MMNTVLSVHTRLAATVLALVLGILLCPDLPGQTQDTSQEQQSQAASTETPAASAETPATSPEQSTNPPEAAAEPQPEPQNVTYRLVRVRIPPNSQYRKNDDRLHNPPSLYVVVLENGKEIGEYSDAATGWEVEYDKSDNNRWTLSSDPSVTYTIQLYDYYWFPRRDQQIVSIVGLHMADFDSSITETVNRHLPQDSAVVFEFRKVTE